MDKIIINGGKPLQGDVYISGAKNAVLPIITACIIAPGKYTLNNVPNLRDTRTMCKLMEMVGATIHFDNNTLQIDTTHCDTPEAPYELVKTMRASFYVLGPFMSRFNYAKVSLPGGCAWGPRPVDFHLKALESLGATVELNHGNIITQGKLTGGDIIFNKKSVGATGNSLMAAVGAEGTTHIVNAACEPDIASLTEFLITMGASIDGVGETDITIHGNKPLSAGFEFDIIPDRIEAGTFMIATALTRGEVTLHNVNPNHLKFVTNCLRETGSTIITEKDTIYVKGSGEIKPFNITTEEYPGFPTDLQAQWIALMTLANGNSKIIDNIYTDRFTHVPELNRFGANINLNQNIASVMGVPKLNAAPVMSTDIRASASLILGALAADGESQISRIYHIDRGYENIEKKFSNLGADIKRVSE